MTKKEIQILKDNFKIAYILLMKDENDNSAWSRVSCLRQLFNDLGLKDALNESKNDAIMESKEFNAIKRETFNNIYKDFKKHGIYVTPMIDDIEYIMEELRYNMTDEEIKCNKARIEILKQG